MGAALSPVSGPQRRRDEERVQVPQKAPADLTRGRCGGPRTGPGKEKQPECQRAYGRRHPASSHARRSGRLGICAGPPTGVAPGPGEVGNERVPGGPSPGDGNGPVGAFGWMGESETCEAAQRGGALRRAIWGPHARHNPAQRLGLGGVALRGSIRNGARTRRRPARWRGTARLGRPPTGGFDARVARRFRTRSATSCSRVDSEQCGA